MFSKFFGDGKKEEVKTLPAPDLSGEFKKLSDDLCSLRSDLMKAMVMGGIIAKLGPGVVLSRSKDEEIRKLIQELFED